MRSRPCVTRSPAPAPGAFAVRWPPSILGRVLPGPDVAGEAPVRVPARFPAGPR